jgi:hypothetical protein
MGSLPTAACPRLLRLSLFLLAALAPACGKTDRPRGPEGERPAALKAFVLYDVQPRGGGDAVWAKKDGSVVVQVVRMKGIAHPDELLEKRYLLKSRPGIFSETELTVGSRNLMALKLEKGSGDRRTTLVLVPESGPTVRLVRQGDASDRGFEQVCSYLHSRCREAEAQEKPVYEGPYDKNWRPDGFERPW